METVGSGTQGDVSEMGAGLDQQRQVGRIELLLSWLLRGGVTVSMVVIAVGAVIMFVHHPSYLRLSSDLQLLTSTQAIFPHTLPAIATGLMATRGRAVVTLGLILLIATPILRVAVSAVIFAVQRDRAFFAITGVVLALLLVSFIMGKAI